MAGITDKEVRSLITRAKSEGRTITHADGAVPGLTIGASRTGVASWVLRYYVQGKRKEATIGQYPAWGIADAREKAKELRRAVDDGVDVAQEKQRRKQEAISAVTVDALAKAYFEKAEKELSPHTFGQRKSIHERFVSPNIGTYRADSITPALIVDVVKKSLAAGKTLPNITLTHCSLIFAHAVGNAVRESNPCRDLKLSAIVGKQDAPKQRTALTAAELAAFLPALETIPRQYALAIRLILLTGVRVGTLTEAMISEFDLDAGHWLVPWERRKNRRHTTGPFVIPLPPMAVEWVRELIKLADRDAHLLPVESRRHSDGRNSMSKRTTVGDWLDKMQGVGAKWRRITPHDLRSTCKSWLSELRVDYETRQRYLDHALEGMDAIYDKADFVEHRRAAADLWLSFLSNLESGKESTKILPFKPMAA
ncbi:tyrosine-type recombinase/integrase [Ferribacterium limneticum]|uniref:tyrosine-type recombinase/integrase n=1 Tax=Ferribacterium limneticum TaxID=76259 RepID=UPI001CF9395F|nr:integrase arm-type DNA-binding domain-containing protein [Ferribacterium limneticum]UCV28121.1 tyrosine-type recombinase/integrase [Ferribacterium limneticum]UCV32038.1 tyrosine-type recombinase/integrase [Ferribacterium limneticum]